MALKMHTKEIGTALARWSRGTLDDRIQIIGRDITFRLNFGNRNSTWITLTHEVVAAKVDEANCDRLTKMLNKIDIKELANGFPDAHILITNNAILRQTY